MNRKLTICGWGLAMFLPLANLGVGQTESILRQRNFRGVISNHHDLGTISVPWRNIYGGKFWGDGSGLTGVTAVATNAGDSSFATNATFALYSTNAGFAGFATNSRFAGFATNASFAGYATNAGFATNAQSASNAVWAVSSSFATNAQSASNAIYSVSASYATQALSATWASNVPPRALIRTNSTVTAGMLYHWLTGETGYWAFITNVINVPQQATNYTWARTLGVPESTINEQYGSNVFGWTAPVAGLWRLGIYSEVVAEQDFESNYNANNSSAVDLWMSYAGGPAMRLLSAGITTDTGNGAASAGVLAGWDQASGGIPRRAWQDERVLYLTNGAGITISNYVVDVSNSADSPVTITTRVQVWGWRDIIVP